MWIIRILERGKGTDGGKITTEKNNFPDIRYKITDWKDFRIIHDIDLKKRLKHIQIQFLNSKEKRTSTSSQTETT